MKMQNVCEGCFYTGVTNGYCPECSDCKRKEAMKTAENASTVNDSEQIEETLLSFSQKDKETARQRRIHKAKADKQTVQILPIVGSKLDKLSDNASQAEHSRAVKKLENVAKAAKLRYQTDDIILSFPEIPEQHNRRKRNISSLISLLEGNSDKKMADAIENSITILKTAIIYDGEICSLHREGNNLHVHIGFLNKASLSNFKRKLSKIPSA